MNTERFEKEYAKLNDAQRKAVDAIEGPVMVIAGPGSGKTQILALRVANILLKTDARPGNILCLTFTDSAAVNMRKRLADLIGPDAYRVAIYTFHSFGTDLIERYPERFYQGARFAPADELAQIEVLEEILGSLPHDDPLRKEHPEQGYTYLEDIRQTIGSLKKAGINPDEFSAILAHNREALEKASAILGPAFDARLSAKNLKPIEDALAKVRKLPQAGFPVPHFKPYAASLSDSLSKAFNDAADLGKTEPLSKWKQGELGKDHDGARVLKDLLALPKLESLAGIYRAYRDRMYELGLFDFDDMLLEAISAIENDSELRYDLQEEFQYVLVDEFQDTNDAQMRMLHGLLSAEVNEGRPNVMVVGDDDQAIYKFQGAQLSNILGFREAYRNPEIVTMTHNYRSSQVILDIARFVIERGEERLERIVPEVRKELVAANPGIEKGAVVSKSFPTAGHEYHFVSREIRRLIDEGEDPKGIAIISRKHSILKDMLPYLNAAGVPVSYERQQDVLREPHVRELIQMLRFVSTLMRKDKKEADHLLPEVLSYPFWNLPRRAVWEISVEADRSGKLWLEVMVDHRERRVREVADFLIGLGGLALHETVEHVLDVCIGSHVALAAESSDEDEDAGAPSVGMFVSPFKEYYFSREKLEKSKADYLIFLSGLRTFIGAVREYKRGKPIKADDVVAFADIHEKNEIAIPDTSAFASAASAVSLVTAHKAKGLEWKTVFVVSCVESVWAGRGIGGKISLPLNLPVSPAGDTTDDQLRLFYVALTRAKSNLYLTASETAESGKEHMKLRFVLPHDAGASAGSEVARLLDFAARPDEAGALQGSFDVLEAASDAGMKRYIVHEEEAILRSLVDGYCLSVTHLNNYLNVAKGGPTLFLEQNLLRFPQQPTLASVYGSAMHKLIERAYGHVRREGAAPGLQEVFGWLASELRRYRLTDGNFDGLLKRGEKAIEAFFREKSDTLRPEHRIEVNFANQGATVGGAHITGKIDKMVDLGGGEWSVHDFKTGAAKSDWTGKDQYEKIKLHQYKYQLVFYKLLVENSREFCDKCVVRRGCLEFLEPLHGKIVELPLDMEREDVERVSKLAEIVFKKITNLEFPDVSGYSQDYAGVVSFEDDLISGKI